jgi:exosortase K
MRSTLRKPILYVMMLVIFILLKWLATLVSVDDLRWMIAPVAYLVGLIKGEYSVFIPGDGYYFPSTEIMINRSCAGLNFYIMSVALLHFLVVRHFSRVRHLVPGFAAAFAAAYILTVLVNTSRIASSLITLHLGEQFLSETLSSRVHEATGVVVVCSFLILIYFSVDYLLKSKLKNEKNC